MNRVLSFSKAKPGCLGAEEEHRDSSLCTNLRLNLAVVSLPRILSASCLKTQTAWWEERTSVPAVREDITHSFLVSV